MSRFPGSLLLLLLVFVSSFCGFLALGVLSWSTARVACFRCVRLALSEAFCFFCLNLWRRGSISRRSWRLGAPLFCGEPFLRHCMPLSLLGLDVMSESHCTNPTGGLLIRPNHKKTYLTRVTAYGECLSLVGHSRL